MHGPHATWDLFLEVESEDGRTVTVSMRDGHDCMYEETVLMQLECALAPREARRRPSLISDRPSRSRRWPPQLSLA